MLPIVINFLLAINIIVCLLIILLTLMQRPKNEGLGAAFGGGMTDNLFGAQTTNALQTITRWLGGIFFALTLLLSWLYVKKDFKRSSLQQRLSAPTAIPAAPAPAIPNGVPTTLPQAVSDPVKADGTPTTQELEKTISKLVEDAAKAKPEATPEAPKPMPATPEGAAPGTTPTPAPEAPKPAETPKSETPAAAPEAAKPAPAPEAAKPASEPEAAKPAPAPEASKPESAPVPAPDKAPEPAKE